MNSYRKIAIFSCDGYGGCSLFGLVAWHRSIGQQPTHHIPSLILGGNEQSRRTINLRRIYIRSLKNFR